MKHVSEAADTVSGQKVRQPIVIDLQSSTGVDIEQTGIHQITFINYIVIIQQVLFKNRITIPQSSLALKESVTKSVLNTASVSS